MITKLRIHLQENFPFLTGKKVLLAVSGGIDSMVLTDLFRQLPFQIAMAHCNFNLRGDESLGDENFVRQYAENHQIQLFVTHFDTKAFADDYKMSIQIAARELRYRWFYELAVKEQFDYILTAHHADDNIETFLINLSRGTGLEGLTGIPPLNDKICRPLLQFSRNEIEAYANEEQLQWREDSSNASAKYVRNKLRHFVLPILKELNPSFNESFQNTSLYLQQALSMADDASRIVYRKVVEEAEEQKRINLKELLILPNYKAYLYQWLKPFGFTAWGDIYALTDATSGKQVFSEDFRLLKDREFLILAPKSSFDNKQYLITEGTKEVNFPLRLRISEVAGISDISNTTIFVDAKKINFPLLLRKWQEGDVFYPLGMQGKTKKVSKLFKDEKLSLIAKENTWLLCSDNKIVWIIGIRQDERFKIQTTTKTILQIALL